MIDKYAEKFQGLSTYQYAALDPIKNIDMNGDSVWTTTTRTQKGKDVYETRTTHITGKVLNTALLKGTTSADGLAKSLNDKYNSQSATDSYKNKDGGTTHITYTMDAKFEAANSISDVKKSDNLVVLVDKVEGKGASQLGGGDAAGLANQNGLIAYVQVGFDMPTMTELAFHEVGHNLGFDDAKVNNVNDPMSYTGVSSKANFSNKQVIDIWYNASSGLLNQGNPRSIITNKQNMDSEGNPVSRSFSTNSSPYTGDRRYGMKIPTPIINPNH